MFQNGRPFEVVVSSNHSLHDCFNLAVEEGVVNVVCIVMEEGLVVVADDEGQVRLILAWVGRGTDEGFVDEPSLPIGIPTRNGRYGVLAKEVWAKEVFLEPGFVPDIG
jgi:hypothetical protein